MDLYWLNKEDILNQVQQERSLCLNVVNNKRELFRERFKLLRNQNKVSNKVNINTSSWVIKTLMSISVADELSVTYQGRNFEDEEIAGNKENLAHFDFEEMDLLTMNIQKQFDRFFFWLSIRVFTSWDDNKKVPVPVLMNPLTWYADPYPKWFKGDDFRFHWFDLEISKADLKEENWYFNIDDIWTYPDEIDKNRDALMDTRFLQRQTDQTPNKRYSIHHHYTKFNNRWYLASVSDKWQNLIRLEELEAITDLEKKNPNMIPCPIILNYYEPERDNIYGANVMDKIEDKQRADSKLFNAQLYKAIEEAMGWVFLYDTNKIKNINKLAQPSLKRRFIWVNLNWWESINSALSEVPRDRLSVDVEQMRQMLKSEVSQSVNLDSVTQWIRSEQRITARESQTIQRNANINLVLQNTIDSIWEKAFWTYHDRMYRQYFQDTDEKIVRLSNGFWSSVVSFTKEDFITWLDIDVKIVNKSDIEAENEKQKLNIPTYEIIAQDPNIPTISKVFIRRKILKIQWVPQDEIKIMIPETYEEQIAKQEIKLLNRNMEIDENWIDPTEDQQTYLMVYNRALNTEAKKKIMKIRERIYNQQLKQKSTQTQSWWQPGMMNNQMVANSLSKQREGSDIASLQDITQ